LLGLTVTRTTVTGNLVSVVTGLGEGVVDVAVTTARNDGNAAGEDGVTHEGG
jgi:hypothetical protein